MSQTKTKNYKPKKKNVTGGFNVAGLILVQAAVWNVLFPAYLLGGMWVFLVGLSVYLTGLVVVAKKISEPAPRYSSMSSEELQKEIDKFNARYEEYKTIPAKLQSKFKKSQPQMSRVEPLLQSTLAQ